MNMEIVSTVHDSNKNMCLRGEEVESVLKCAAVFVTRPTMMFEDLMCVFQERV
jgi:hypothetical protein